MKSQRRLLRTSALIAGLAAAIAFPSVTTAQGDTLVAAASGRSGSFTDARAFSLPADGRIAVIDGGTGNLVMLAPDGSVERTLNGKGWGELGFDNPSDVDATQTIRIYVADEGNHRVQIFDGNLNFISSLDGQIASDNSFQFRYPRSVAVSRHNDIFVLDGDNARIVKFDPTGAVAADFGGFNAGAGRLEAPSRIRMSAADILAVIDGNDLVLYDLYGNYLMRWRSPAPISACAPDGSTRRWLVATDSTLVLIEPVESECRLVGPVEPAGSDGSRLAIRAIRDVAMNEHGIAVLTAHEIIRLTPAP